MRTGLSILALAALAACSSTGGPYPVACSRGRPRRSIRGCRSSGRSTTGPVSAGLAAQLAALVEPGAGRRRRLRAGERRMPSSWPAPPERRRARAGSRPRRRFRRRSRRASRPRPRSATSMRWAQPRSRRKAGLRAERSCGDPGRGRRGRRARSAPGGADRRDPGAPRASRPAPPPGRRASRRARSRKTICGLTSLSGPKRVVDEVEVLAALHAEALHQPLACGIGGNGDGDHLRRGEAAEGEVEAGDRRFLGDALPPAFRTQPPADLELAGEIARAGRIDALEPAEAEDLAGRAVLDDPEGVAELALVADARRW